MYWTVHLSGGPRRVNHAAVAIGMNIFTFGGYSSSVNYNTFKPIDIYILDTVKLNWLKLKYNYKNQDYDKYSIPFQRYGHTAVAHGSKIYLWGGRNNEKACNILYCFDSETLTWSTPEIRGKYIPVPRDGHSACVIKNCMYIFGGFQDNPSQFSQDLYMLDLNTMIWSIVQTMGNPPSHRDFHTATAINNKMYIFGGRGERTHRSSDDHEHYCPDIYYFDITTGMWVCPTINSPKPPGRRSHSAFVHRGFLYIFGGYNRNLDVHFKDINRYNPENKTWMTISTKGTSPCARRRQICLVIDDRVFISGGTSPISHKSSTNLRLQEFNFEEQLLNELKDHDDLHVLELNPSLKHMCLVNVSENIQKMESNIDDLFIPQSLKEDLAAINSSGYRDTKSSSLNNEKPI